MTVIVHIGRRVPKNWFKRQANKAMGFISFQENLWLMIKQSMQMAKRKANASGTGVVFTLTKDEESEDLYYKIEWLKVLIKGTYEQEKDEYNDSMKMYSTLSTIFKKDTPINESMKKHFKSKILNEIKIEEAYKQGYGSMSDNNIANKLLEMGILTHIEWIQDFNNESKQKEENEEEAET